MPEGHTVHRAARRQTALLAGGSLAASSPQGRFSDGAAALDGRVLAEVEAVGKHLFYRFDRDEVLHVHLGLFGRFREHPVPPPESRGLIRLRLVGAEAAVDLSGPTACDLVGEEGRERIVARLGEDPLRPDGDPERAIADLARRRVAIGGALLDQRIIAGLGNVFRAEVLFVCGIDPRREARALSAAELRCVWDASARMLQRNVRRGGGIVTTDPQEIGRPISRMRRSERTYVYRQEICRRCGTDIRVVSLANRPCYWCPECQS